MAKREYTRAQREEVFELLRQGLSAPKVSARLGIPCSTVKSWGSDPSRGCLNGPPLGVKVVKAGQHEWRSLVGWGDRE